MTVAADRRTIQVTMSESTVLQLDDFARQVSKRRSWVIEQLVLLASWESLVEAIEDGEVEV